MHQGPTTQQKTAAAEVASGGPVVAPDAAVAPAATLGEGAGKQSPSSPAALSATSLPPLPTVQAASGLATVRAGSGFER